MVYIWRQKVYGAMTIAYKPSFQYIQKIIYIYLKISFTAVCCLCGYKQNNLFALYNKSSMLLCVYAWSVGVRLELDFDEATTRNTYKRNARTAEQRSYRCANSKAPSFEYSTKDSKYQQHMIHIRICDSWLCAVLSVLSHTYSWK